MDSRVWDCASLTSSDLASVRAKDAVCDAMRDAYRGSKPPAPARDAPADLPLFLTVYRDAATLYRDMSGASLHKRGYRSAMHRASLNESVAAAVLLLAAWDRVALLPGATKVNHSSTNSTSDSNSSSSDGNNSTSDVEDSASLGWAAIRGESSMMEDSGTLDSRSRNHVGENSDSETTDVNLKGEGPGSGDAGRGNGGVPEVVILDPMCGSGTLLIEAALLATRTAPGLFRTSWPFQVSTLSHSPSSNTVSLSLSLCSVIVSLCPGDYTESHPYFKHYLSLS